MTQITHRRRLELLREIQAGNRSLGQGQETKLKEWQLLEVLGDINLKVKYESMTHAGQLHKAVALLTETGKDYLENHADEFGGPSPA